MLADIQEVLIQNNNSSRNKFKSSHRDVIHEVINHTLDSVRNVLSVKRVHLFILDVGETKFTPFASSGNLDLENFKSITIKSPDYLMSSVFYSKKTHFISDVLDPKNPYLLDDEILALIECGSFCAAPLLINDQILGVIIIDNTRHRMDLSQADLDKIQFFANQAALAIGYAKNFIELEERNQELKSERDKLQALLNGLGESILVIDHNYEVKQMNEVAQKFFEVEFIDGLSLKQLCRKGILCNAVQNTGLNKKGTQLIMDIEVDAATYYYEVSTVYYEVEQKEYVILIIRDVTERFTLEEAKDNFIRTTSHELRTPLVSIIGSLDLVLSQAFGLLDSQNKKYIEKALKNSLQLRDLVNNLLDLSKIDSGLYKLNIVPFNIVGQIEEIIDEMDSLIRSKGLLVKLETSSPFVYVKADAKYIKRVLVNLIGNAVKFTEQGQITVTVREAGTLVDISVKDTGIGISPEHQQVIFERFTQAANTHDRKHEGSGLGLSIVKGFLDMHASQIKLQSELGVGSEFSFELPLVKKTISLENKQVSAE